MIVGTGNDTVSRLAAASTNGYLLAVNSATATGLEWQSAPAGYLAPTIGTTVITSGTTVSTIESVTLSNATLSGTLTAGATSGTNGYLLTSTGSGVQWAAAPVSLPSQTGNDGKALVTNGTTASWSGAVPVAQTTEPTTLIDGLIWLDTDGTVVGQNQTRWSKAPAGGTTSLSGVDDNGLTLSYTTGYEQVYRNGVLLSRGNDYTATNGTSVTLIDATIAGDIIEIFASAVLALTDVYTQAQVDAKVATQNNSLLNNPIVKSPEERWTTSATSATGTVNFDAFTQGVLYYTSNASGNWTLNIRGDSTTTLNSMLTTGDSITVAFFVTNGGTAYYQTGFQIDGSSVTPKWSGGTAPAAGNASSIDIYSFSIVKTANATFTVFGAGPVKYA